MINLERKRVQMTNNRNNEHIHVVPALTHVGSGRARLAHPDNEVMFFLSPTNTTLTARQAGKQQQDETWQNVTTNVCLRLTATVPHNELFKVLLLKILISLCWNESSHRGVIWATFVQTDGGGKLLFGIFCTFFKHVCKMINIKKKTHRLSACPRLCEDSVFVLNHRDGGRCRVGSALHLSAPELGRRPSVIFCYCGCSESWVMLTHLFSLPLICFYSHSKSINSH